MSSGLKGKNMWMHFLHWKTVWLWATFTASLWLTMKSSPGWGWNHCAHTRGGGRAGVLLHQLHEDRLQLWTLSWLGMKKWGISGKLGQGRTMNKTKLCHEFSHVISWGLVSSKAERTVPHWPLLPAWWEARDHPRRCTGSSFSCWPFNPEPWGDDGSER